MSNNYVIEKHVEQSSAVLSSVVDGGGGLDSIGSVHPHMRHRKHALVPNGFCNRCRVFPPRLRALNCWREFDRERSSTTSGALGTYIAFYSFLL